MLSTFYAMIYRRYSVNTSLIITIIIFRNIIIIIYNLSIWKCSKECNLKGPFLK